MKKLLVTGISGFLGSHIIDFEQSDWEIIGTYNKKKIEHPSIQTIKIDLINHESVDQLFNEINPDAVLHMAAASNANFCEKKPKVSLAINTEVTGYLAILCQEKDIPFLFTSTDLVFDGQNAPYKETDKPQPICLYGVHKLIAEKQALNLHPMGACIARLPLMYGWSSTADSFLSSWVKQLQKGISITAFVDEFRTTISANAAIKGLFLLLNNAATGIYHLGGKERISRYDFAIKMAEHFNLPTDLIEATRQLKVKMPAARPPDVSFESTKAYDLGFDPELIAEGLAGIKEKGQLNFQFPV